MIICADLDSLSSHQGKMIVNTEHTSGIDKDICNCHNPFYSQRIMQDSIILLFISGIFFVLLLALKCVRITSLMIMLYRWQDLHIWPSDNTDNLPVFILSIELVAVSSFHSQNWTVYSLLSWLFISNYL